MNPNYNYIDTELSAVNSILGSIGQAPVQSLDLENPEIYLIHNILQECTIDVLNEGWHFNTESHVTLKPDKDGYIYIPPNALSYDISEGQNYKLKDVALRDGRLYDKTNHTYVFTDNLDIDIVWLYGFDADLSTAQEDYSGTSWSRSSTSGQSIPSVFKRYIIAKACVKAANQLINNLQLVESLRTQETITRASCMEYECNCGDWSYLGTPESSIYNSYKPYITLSRN